MSVTEPQWKVKTRPCPFYSQGRCLFSDSCNFLHAAKVQRVESAVTVPHDSLLPSPPESPTQSPRMVPKLVRFQSPPRSPRMSSLLLALGDAIEQDESDSGDDEEEGESAAVLDSVTTASPEALVNELEDGSHGASQTAGPRSTANGSTSGGDTSRKRFVPPRSLAHRNPGLEALLASRFNLKPTSTANRRAGIVQVHTSAVNPVEAETSASTFTQGTGTVSREPEAGESPSEASGEIIVTHPRDSDIPLPLPSGMLCTSETQTVSDEYVAEEDTDEGEDAVTHKRDSDIILPLPSGLRRTPNAAVMAQEHTANEHGGRCEPTASHARDSDARLPLPSGLRRTPNADAMAQEHTANERGGRYETTEAHARDSDARLPLPPGLRGPSNADAMPQEHDTDEREGQYETPESHARDSDAWLPLPSGLRRTPNADAMAQEHTVNERGGRCETTASHARDSDARLPLPPGLRGSSNADAMPQEHDTDECEGQCETPEFHARDSEARLPLPPGLLSPIEIASAAPVSLPLEPEPAPVPELTREDPADSGFVNTWFVPPTFHRSPPRSPRPRPGHMSTLSILSSPFGTPTGMRRVRPFSGSGSGLGLGFDPEYYSPAVADLFSPRFAAIQDIDARSAHYSDVDDEPLSRVSSRSSGSISSSSDEDPFGGDVTITQPPSEEPAVPPQRSSPVRESTGPMHLLQTVVEETATDLSPNDSPVAASASPVEFSTLFSATGEDAVQDLYDDYLTSPNMEQGGASPDLPSSFEVGSSSRPIVPRIYTGGDIGTVKPQQRPPLSLRSPLQLQEEPPRSFSPAIAKSKSPTHEECFTPDSASGEHPRDRQASTKVPFAWRQSATVDSIVAPRKQSTPTTVRPRPPALVGFNAKSHDRSGLKELQLLSPEGTGSVPNSAGGLKPLRLSMILTSSAPSSASTLVSSNPPSLITGTSAYTSSSPTVSSDYSISHNPLLSSRRSSSIPSPTGNTLINAHTHTPLQYVPPSDKATRQVPHSAPVSNNSSPKWHTRQPPRSRLSYSSSQRFSRMDRFQRPDSRMSEPAVVYEDEGEGDNIPTGWNDPRPTSSMAHALSPPSPIHAIATPRPTLLFALASDNVDEVRRVLESGEAGPNDDVGPQSALAFTLASRQLTHRMEMVKLLLAYGADPTVIKDDSANVTSPSSSSGRTSPSPPLEELDPATRYYVKRAKAPETRRASALIHRSFFRPLARVRYNLIGQDRALEQLFRVLSMPSMAPIVVLLCGPSGHGKSLLARKFGMLLEVPTHTVNMTTLRSTHDIWRSYSMSPYEPPSSCTLADFLIAHEGKRCIVVLDEIEKVVDEKILSSLLMPWELGRCSFEGGHRHIDVSQVIWLGTSNIGHDLVFEHQRERANPDATMLREEYVDLMAMLRPRVSEKLGASLLSRVTTVLPFVPFSADEKMAIAAEALYSLLPEDTAHTIPPATVDMVVRNSLSAYQPAEGARSLYRAVSTLLLDTL